MRKLGIGIALALVSAMLLALPVLANGKAGENGSGGKGRVDGHLEGANPVAAKVCVDFNGDGTNDVCETIERPDNSGFGITIPKPSVPTATFSAWAGPNLGDLAPAVNSLTGEACDALPVDGSGMALCQDPRSEVVKRVNINWNANAANGNVGKDGADGR